MNSRQRKKPCFAVLGAGNGGQAMAAHLALMGFQVHLYNRSPERLAPIQARGGIELRTSEQEGLPHGFAALEVVTDDIAKVLAGVDIVMVAVPANGHAFMAEQCALHLRDGQIVVLNPGRTGGALEFANVLRQRGVQDDVIIAEAQTFLYACRAENPGQVRIFRIKNSIPVAALPAYRTVEVVRALSVALPQFIPGDNVIRTSMDNIGAVFHPAVTVLNAARIESTNGDFEFYIDGITPSVARVLELIDAERVAVAAAMGFRAITAREWLYLAYDAAGRNLYEAIRANHGYKGIQAPISLNTRYLHEDVPFSLVPIASLGRMFKVPAPRIEGIIELASTMNECDYWAEGRTVERLGLAGRSLREIRHFVIEGFFPEEGRE